MKRIYTYCFQKYTRINSKIPEIVKEKKRNVEKKMRILSLNNFFKTVE